MANNIFQVKRTSTAGRTPNTTGSYATNSQYIAAGELALNMTDGILYSSDGTNLITIGSNATSHTSGAGYGTATGGAVVNATTIAIGNSSVNVSINSTAFSGTSNNSTNLGGTAASGYQTTAGLSSNVATLTANNTSFVGTVSAANVVSNAQLSGNLSSYVTTTNLTNNLANYQTTAGLSSNVATLTSNNATNLGGVAAASYVNTAGNYTLAGNINFTGTNVYHTSTLYVGGQVVIGATGDIVLANGSGIQANGVWGTAGQALLTDGSGNDYWGLPTVLTANNASYLGTVAAANYQGTANLSSAVALLSANNSSYLGGTAAASYQLNSTLSANVATLSSNNSSYLGGVAAASYVNTSGTYTITGAHTYNANVALTGGTITTLATNSTDIVNKQYADAIATGVNFHAAVRLVTNTDLGTVTYNNGTSGVGATLTKTTTFAALVVDTVTAAYQDRILVRAQTNTALNGIYTVSNTGNASSAWVLTRATDYDQVGSGYNEIDKGDLIYVTEGSVGAGTSWVESATVTTIGTDPITFVQFSSKALYALTGGTGLYYAVGAAYDGSAATTLAVNSSYIATISANNASYLGTIAAANYQGTANLAAAVALLPANNATYLNSQLASYYTNATNITTGTLPWAQAPAGTVNTSGSFTIGGILTYSANVLLNNNVDLNFKTLSGSNVSFVQQNDDNFVMYSTNTTGGQRAVWSVYANSITSNLNFSVRTVHNGGLTIPTGVTLIDSTGAQGTAGQVLTSNGTGNVYWSSVSSGSVNTAAQYTWTNTQTFSANINFTGSGIGISTNTGALYFNGTADGNWRIGRNTGSTTKYYYTNNSLDIIAAASNLEGLVIGQASGNTYFETGYAGTFTKNPVYVGNATVNLSINSTAIVGNTITVGSSNTAVFYNYNGQVNPSNNFTGNAYALFGGFGGNYLAFGQTNTFHQWIQSGFPSAVSPVYYNILLNPLGGNVGIGNTAPVDRLSVNGTTYLQGNVRFTQGIIDSTGTQGTAGQVLASNGTGNVYWSTLPSYTFSTGLTNTTNTITVNASYIATISANNASYLGGTAAASYQLNSTLNANIASYLPTYAGVVNASSLTTGGGYQSATGGAVVNSTSIGLGNTTVSGIISSNTTAVYFTGIANNSLYLGGIAAASYALLASPTFTGTVTSGSINSSGTVNAAALSIGTTWVANATGVYMTMPLSGNGSVGTSGQILTSNGATGSPYWSNQISFSTGLINTSGTVTVNASYIATISANNASYLGGTAAASYALLASPTFTGTVTTANLTLAGSTISNYTEFANASISSSTAQTIPANTNIVRYSLTANCTLTLPLGSSVITTNSVKNIVVFVKQDATGGRTLTFANQATDTILYNNSVTMPQPASGANKVSIYTLQRYDGDSNWYVSLSFLGA